MMTMTVRAHVAAILVYVGLAATAFGVFWWMDHYW